MAVAAGCQTYPPTTFQVCGRIRDKYNQTGGPAGFLLFPKSNELTNPGNTGKRTEFVGGNIYWSAATDAHPVAHEFLTKWGEKGYESGYLKYPTTDEIVLSDGTSRRQEYQGGSIYFAFGIGAHTIQGSIRDKWRAMGAENGALGFPTSDEMVTPDGKGRYNTFQHGSIYWSPTTGAHAVSGIILAEWALANYEQGTYGYPTSDQYTNAGGHAQDFQGGTIDYGLAETPVSKTFHDCQLNLSWPEMSQSSNWVGSRVYANCTDPKRKIEVRLRTFWTPAGSSSEVKKDDDTSAVTTPAGQVKTFDKPYVAACFNGTYRFTAEFKITNADGGVMTAKPHRTDKIEMNSCQTAPQNCPGISQDDCREAKRTVLYARWFNGASRPGYAGNKPFGNTDNHLPAASGQWVYYDVYPPGPNGRLAERVVLDSGTPVFAPVWFSKDHFDTQEGWTKIDMAP
jgi:hypothetical protein